MKKQEQNKLDSSASVDSLSYIKKVMQHYEKEILSINGVKGIYIGKLENGQYCIGVLMTESDTASIKKIPKSLDGIPILIEMTDEIKPM